MSAGKSCFQDGIRFTAEVSFSSRVATVIFRATAVLTILRCRLDLSKIPQSNRCWTASQQDCLAQSCLKDFDNGLGRLLQWRKVGFREHSCAAQGGECEFELGFQRPCTGSRQRGFNIDIQDSATNVFSSADDWDSAVDVFFNADSATDVFPSIDWNSATDAFFNADVWECAADVFPSTDDWDSAAMSSSALMTGTAQRMTGEANKYSKAPSMPREIQEKWTRMVSACDEDDVNVAISAARDAVRGMKAQIAGFKCDVDREATDVLAQEMDQLEQLAKPLELRISRTPSIVDESCCDTVRTKSDLLPLQRVQSIRSASENSSSAQDGQSCECKDPSEQALDICMDITSRKPQRDSDASSPTPMRSRAARQQKWPNCVAVGPTEAWLDLYSEGRY